MNESDVKIAEAVLAWARSPAEVHRDDLVFQAQASATRSSDRGSAWDVELSLRFEEGALESGQIDRVVEALGDPPVDRTVEGVGVVRIVYGGLKDGIEPSDWTGMAHLVRPLVTVQRVDD